MPMVKLMKTITCRGATCKQVPGAKSHQYHGGLQGLVVQANASCRVPVARQHRLGQALRCLLAIGQAHWKQRRRRRVVLEQRDKQVCHIPARCT